MDRKQKNYGIEENDPFFEKLAKDQLDYFPKISPLSEAAYAQFLLDSAQK